MNKKDVLKKLFLHIGIPLAVVIVSAHVLFVFMYEEVLSLNIFLFVISFFLTFFISILWHELGHLSAFLIQGYEIKGFFVLGLGVTKRPFKFHLDAFTMKMLGGIVIPKLKTCTSDLEFSKRLKELRIALIFGPIFTYIGPFILILMYVFVPTPFTYVMIWYSFGMLIIFHKSFYVSHSGLFGDLKAFHMLKSKHDILLLMYHQHLMLYDINKETHRYTYKKAFHTWNHMQAFNMTSDMQLMMMVIDGVRFGYLKDGQALNWDFKQLSKHAYYKREAYQQLLVYYICMALYLKHEDSASQYYTYMLKHAKKYEEALALLHVFVYHEPMSNTLFEQALSDLSIYRYIVDEQVFKNYFKSMFHIHNACDT